MASKADHRNPLNVIPYLDGPPLRIDVVLPQLLENIEAELATGKLETGEERRLCRRAELIRGLLARSRVT